ncbi:MAG: Holliday junction resolvase RuvX [Actinomycetaceae bacterium]|nr:Holliday junction resolvase RuvX [Actinomycetaceae bacterium]
MRSGKRIGIDVGKERIGVALSDTDGILASPIATVPHNHADIRIITKHIKNNNALEVIIGRPTNMDGSQGEMVHYVTSWAQKLARRIAPVPIRLFDERLSSAQAHKVLDVNGRKKCDHTSVVDQVAAVLILQSALEYESTTGLPPGTPLNETIVSEND